MKFENITTVSYMNYDTQVLSIEERIFLATFLILCGIIGAIFNGLFIMTYIHNKRLRNPTNMFIASMTVSSFLMCIVSHPVDSVSCIYGYWRFGHNICVLEGFTVFFLGLTNMYSLSVISVDRYIVICKPKQFGPVTRDRAIISILSCWTMGLLWSCFPLLGWNSYRLEKTGFSCSVIWDSNEIGNISFIITIFLTCFLVPIFIMTCCYTMIFYTVRSVSRNSVWDMTSRVARKNLRIEKKMAKTIGMMIGVFLLSWGPYAVVSFWSAFGDSSGVPALLAAAPPFLAKSSTVWNPIIYVGTNKQFRCAFYSILPCTSLKDKLVKKEEEKPASSKESDLDDKTKATEQVPTKTTQVKPVAVEEPSQGVSQVEATVVEELSPPNSAKGGRKPEGTEMKELKS